MNDLYNIIPLNPPVSTIELRGEEIKAMLEENLESTLQGVPQKYGRNRENRSERVIDTLRAYLIRHHILYAELKGTFVVV
ncbi:hypothetical protein A2V47_07530 [Candidatus Atribacteria bacterium RBG_19FT_COMBO_35_14]|uniref:5'-Nucleotidase C-terminal domain-containing protein n=1 Tax=Candidatus Sediminicultor quintus TaxID=1797291 RepID=A0A1F5AAX3_9BACT|nr:MAG: hypothetical protein A2V47_07530 [Candidatus Atribacteria bacterium RBG_19FT_COMBO_35_14]